MAKNKYSNFFSKKVHLLLIIDDNVSDKQFWFNQET